MATIAALKTCDLSKTTLLIGGYDRGHDWHDFVKQISQNQPNVLIVSGANSALICEIISKKNRMNFYKEDNLKKAIALAKRKTQNNGLILLSPGAPSFDQFENYIQRGEFFEKELRRES